MFKVFVVESPFSRVRIENRSVKKIRITGQCDLLNLEDDVGSRNEVQYARCARVGSKSGGTPYEDGEEIQEDRGTG